MGVGFWNEQVCEGMRIELSHIGPRALPVAMEKEARLKTEHPRRNKRRLEFYRGLRVILVSANIWPQALQLQEECRTSVAPLQSGGGLDASPDFPILARYTGTTADLLQIISRERV